MEHGTVRPFEKPRYGVVRLCGGKSIMLTPRPPVQIGMGDAEGAFAIVSRMGDEFVKVDWNGVAVTLYQSGSMLFYHLDDRDVAERYADEILGRLGFPRTRTGDELNRG